MKDLPETMVKFLNPMASSLSLIISEICGIWKNMTKHPDHLNLQLFHHQHLEYLFSRTLNPALATPPPTTTHPAASHYCIDHRHPSLQYLNSSLPSLSCLASFRNGLFPEDSSSRPLESRVRSPLPHRLRGHIFSLRYLPSSRVFLIPC